MQEDRSKFWYFVGFYRAGGTIPPNEYVRMVDEDIAFDAIKARQFVFMEEEILRRSSQDKLIQTLLQLAPEIKPVKEEDLLTEEEGDLHTQVLLEAAVDAVVERHKALAGGAAG